MIENLFPTPVLRGSILRDISKEELDAVNAHKQNIKSNAGNITSLCDTVLEQKEFSKIRERIQYYLNEYVDQVYNPEDESLEFHITQSWLNWSGKGEWH